MYSQLRSKTILVPGTENILTNETLTQTRKKLFLVDQAKDKERRMEILFDYKR